MAESTTDHKKGSQLPTVNSVTGKNGNLESGGWSAYIGIFGEIL
jgi:hypothetical protein